MQSQKEQTSAEKRHTVSILSVMIVSLATLAFTGLLRSEMRTAAGREIAATATLKTIYGAEQVFKTRKGRYGTLKELADEELIERNFAEGKTSYLYRYADSNVSGKTFCIHADRVSYRSGMRDFNITESGAIHFVRSWTPGTVPRGKGTRVEYVGEKTSSLSRSVWSAAAWRRFGSLALTSQGIEENTKAAPGRRTPHAPRF
jgi:hypothetical protein